METIKTRIELLKLLPPDAIGAELGVAEGLFSRDLLEGGLKSLFMVDVWAHVPNVKGDANSTQDWHNNNYENAMRLVEPFGKRAVVLRGFTTEMAKTLPDDILDLLYHDAGHLQEEVKADLEAWFPKVRVGGVVAFHDYFMEEYGVKKAVEEFCRDKYAIIPIPEKQLKDAGAYFIK